MDFSFSCHQVGQNGYYFEIQFYAPFISFESPALAMLLVLGSVYFALVLIAGLNRTLGLVPSCTIGFSNMLTWIALRGTNFDDTTWTYVFVVPFALLALSVFLALMKWHTRQSPQKTAIHTETVSCPRTGLGYRDLL
ncbi:MAG: hypothetical protein ACUVT7_00105 [Thermoplasmata archaeon]